MSIGIAVMAKAPRAGQSKTRLLPLLSGEEAAELSAAFLRDVTENLASAARVLPIVPYVAYAPAGTQALFAGLLARHTGLLLADGSADAPAGVAGFGRCLLGAVQGLFELGHMAACVLNADSPTLPTERLVEAAAALVRPGDRAVLGPAEDGGYYLLGMKRVHAGLFARIEWSTDQVAAQTRRRAAELGIELLELDPWYDVDEPGSLVRLMRELDGLSAAEIFEAPTTRACVGRLNLAARLADTTTETQAGARPCPPPR